MTASNLKKLSILFHVTCKVSLSPALWFITGNNVCSRSSPERFSSYGTLTTPQAQDKRTPQQKIYNCCSGSLLPGNSHETIVEELPCCRIPLIWKSWLPYPLPIAFQFLNACFSITCSISPLSLTTGICIHSTRSRN